MAKKSKTGRPGRSASRASFREKLRKEQPARIVDIPLRWQKTYGKGTMVIPCPLDVDRLMRKAGKGKLLTVNQVRDFFARRHRASHACPLTTGIFIRIAAEAAEEDRAEGKKRITPYWRTIKSDGSLNEKYPGGVKAQARRLREEGHRIEPARGKRPPRVRDFEAKLQRLPS
jgi:hypothetical protein